MSFVEELQISGTWSQGWGSFWFDMCLWQPAAALCLHSTLVSLLWRMWKILESFDLASLGIGNFLLDTIPDLHGRNGMYLQQPGKHILDLHAELETMHKYSEMKTRIYFKNNIILLSSWYLKWCWYLLELWKTGRIPEAPKLLILPYGTSHTGVNSLGSLLGKKGKSSFCIAAGNTLLQIWT